MTQKNLWMVKTKETEKGIIVWHTIFIIIVIILLWAAKSKYYDRKTNNQVSLASTLNLQISFWHVHNGCG